MTNTTTASTRTASWGSLELVFSVLVALTVVNALMGRWGLSGWPWSLVIYGLALFKSQLIGDHFMQLKQVQGWWRWAVSIWLLLVGTLVGTAFALSAHTS